MEWGQLPLRSKRKHRQPSRTYFAVVRGANGGGGGQQLHWGEKGARSGELAGGGESQEELISPVWGRQ